MAFRGVLFYLLVCCNSNLINHVSARLKSEGLVGGYLAEPGEFKYQVAILGRQNYTRGLSLICSGVIIDDDLILTSAQCFIDESWNLRMLNFVVELDTVDLKSRTGLQYVISKIYIPDNDYPLYYKDLAVAKLKESLSLGYNTYMQKVDIPAQGESFAEMIGVVTGYGYTWIETYVDPQDNVRKRGSGGSPFTLKQANVQVARGVDCMNNYTNANASTQLCGVMLPQPPNQRWGLCARDTGSPLVIDNKVVGIAIRIPVDCDDTRGGTIYTKVSAFSLFIELIKGGSPLIMEDTILSSAIVYRNRRYFRRVPRT